MVSNDMRTQNIH